MLGLRKMLLFVLVLVPAVVFAADFQYYSGRGAKLLQAKKPDDSFVGVFRFEIGYTHIGTECVNENRFGIGLNHIGVPKVKFIFFDLEAEVGQRRLEFFGWDSVRSVTVLKDKNMIVSIFRPTINIENRFLKLMVTDEFVLDGIKYIDMNTVIGRLLLYPTKHIRSELTGSYTYLDNIEKINRLQSEYMTGKFRMGWDFSNVKLLRRKLPGFELGVEMFLGERYQSSIWETRSSGRVGPYLKTGFQLGPLFFWTDVSFQPGIEMINLDKSLNTETSKKDNRLDLRIGMYIFD